MVKPKAQKQVINQVPTNSANDLARYLHDAFMGKNDLLTTQQIISSGVRYDTSRENTTERLDVSGEIDDQRAYETLSYSPKNCKWYFTTVFKAPGSKVISRRIAAGNDSSIEIIKSLNESIFMQRLKQVLANP